MPTFPKPDVDYTYNVQHEIEALRRWEREEGGRDIPNKAGDRLLIASWNIANLGAQERRDSDYQLIAEVINWFDLIAVQEVKEDLSGLRAIQTFLPSRYKVLFSDTAGNDERLTFIYDSEKVETLEQLGEIAIPPSDHRFIKFDTIQAKFEGFDRNPYVGSFRAGAFNFVLINVHLYFGSMSTKEKEQASINRRCLETYAVARWADSGRRRKTSYLHDIIAIGDFNLPSLDEKDLVRSALTRKGLHLPLHQTAVEGRGSSLSGEHYYDQVAFHPSETRGEFTGNTGVFDFDGPIFGDLWQRFMDDNAALTPARQKKNALKAFHAYLRYYLSDHRPLWIEFDTSPQ